MVNPVLVNKTKKDIRLSYSKDIESKPLNSRSFHTYSRCDNIDISNDTYKDLTVKGKKLWLILDKPIQNSQSKAVEFMLTEKAVTANVINKILSIYNTHTTDEALKV